MMIEKGIYFDDIHSYYDFGLILSKTEIPPATPKTNYIDIPGGDGSIDLSEVHGDVKYNDRDCKFTFTVAKSINESEWEELKTKVNNALNGKTFKITLDKDPDYYYHGRCIVNGYAVNKRLRQIIVDARVSPWKYKQAKTILYFDLPTDADGMIVYLPNSRKPVCPVIACSCSGTALYFNDAEYILEQGTQKILDIQLQQGTTAVRVVCREANNIISFSYQEGDL